MSGDFTNRLSELKSGTKIIIDGPAGHFTRINSHHRKMLFIAGGIGITPFVSMAEEMKFGTRDAVLLYSVKTQKDLVFKQEFDHMDMRSFIFISEGDAGEYYNGRINIDVIQNLVPDLRDRDVYICGPDLMMTSLSRELQKLGMSRDQIHFERFAF
jgi:ferredoxin-NADP reductase